MAYTTINKSGDYFNTKLYTGNGGTQSITGVGFQPDFTWLKCRNDAQEHRLTDVVRGTTKGLESNSTLAEFTTTNTLTSFDSDGFSLGNSAVSNYSGNTHVSWNWKANGAGSANTDGSISSTVSVNTTSGFSIVKYTGNGSGEVSIGHGLGTTPKVMIVKSLSSGNWFFYTTVIDNSLDYLFLNLTDAKGDSSATAPTSSVIYGVQSTNQAENYIAYCFAEKTGYSKFGSYTGNGSTDGTFVYTGFKPAFVMVKNTETSSNAWNMFDAKRSPFNILNARLYASANASEGTGNMCDFLSNGVKFRNTDSDWNSTHKFIYMAFAQAPLVGTNNVPCTAR